MNIQQARSWGSGKVEKKKEGTVLALISSFVLYQDSNNGLNESCEFVRLNNHKKVKTP